MMTTPDDWSVLIISIFIGLCSFAIVLGAILYKLAGVGVYP